MAPMKKKTRKRITKQMRKLVKKHGPEAMTSIVATAVSVVEAKKRPNPAEPTNHQKVKKAKSTIASHTPA